MNNIIITIKKELRSIFRDRKTLIMLFVLPIMIPVFIVIYGYMFDNLDGTMNETSKIAINYNLTDVEKEIVKNNYLEIENIKNEKECQEKLKSGELTAYIILKDNIYNIYSNSTESSTVIISKITNYLDAYNRYQGEKYVTENKLDSNKVFNNITYKVHMESNTIILNMIYAIAFTYTIMAIVIASSNMAMSATATEKENGTLETILTMPIKTSELIVGKHMGGAIMSFIVSLFSFAITIIGLIIGKNSFQSFKEFNIIINARTIISSIVILLAASILISGLAISLTAFAKTTKEAQSKTQILTFLSIIPMFISILEIDISKYIYYIPICNYSEALMNIFNNKIQPINIAIVLLSSIIYIGIIIKVIINLYKEEKVLFSN